MDWGLVIAGLIVGGVVGLTGMGGGALMTPVLVLVFKVEPLAAISSDLVASFFMKPIGGVVHLRRGTVNLDLVKWLCIGSVPCAFLGVFVLKSLGQGAGLQDNIKRALGIALLLAASGIILKTFMTMRERVRRRRAGLPGLSAVPPKITIRPLPTIAIGAIGGLVVGMTSVGSGSLIIVALLALYPTLQASQLVGTDLVQAVPLVGAAALGHYLYGDFQADITFSLLVGAIPGVYMGARGSSGAPGGVVRRALSFVLLASGLKLLGVSTVTLGWILLGVVVVGPFVWMAVRRSMGLPPLARQEIAARRAELEVAEPAAEPVIEPAIEPAAE